MTLPTRNLHSLALFHLHDNFRRWYYALVSLCTDLPVIIITPGIHSIDSRLRTVPFDAHNYVVIVTTLNFFDLKGFEAINKTWSSHLVII